MLPKDDSYLNKLNSGRLKQEVTLSSKTSNSIVVFSNFSKELAIADDMRQHDFLETDLKLSRVNAQFQKLAKNSRLSSLRDSITLV
jgi:hypothetical protein